MLPIYYTAKICMNCVSVNQGELLDTCRFHVWSLSKGTHFLFFWATRAGQINGSCVDPNLLHDNRNSQLKSWFVHLAYHHQTVWPTATDVKITVLSWRAMWRKCQYSVMSSSQLVLRKNSNRRTHIVYLFILSLWPKVQYRQYHGKHYVRYLFFHAKGVHCGTSTMRAPNINHESPDNPEHQPWEPRSSRTSTMRAPCAEMWRNVWFGLI